MHYFGFELKKKKIKEIPALQPRDTDGGGIIDLNAFHSGIYSTAMDNDLILRTESELIERYRQISAYSDCSTAIDHILNSALFCDEDDNMVKINLDHTDLSEKVKRRILEEFDVIYNIFNFDDLGYEIFKNWYVDGRIYFEVVIDTSKPKEGIKDLRRIDPRKIRKMSWVIRDIDPKTRTPYVKKTKEYFIFNDRGIIEGTSTLAAAQSAAAGGAGGTSSNLILPVDKIVYADSGMKDANGVIMSHVHKAIKPCNQLQKIEDSDVIYKVARAPERRIFYIDVGNMSPTKATQYVAELAQKYRKRIIYDANTGELKDDRNHLSMLEDYWMMRKEGGRGTEITTLPSSGSFSDITQTQYFQNKLFTALNVPVTRLQQQTGFSLGRSGEITREEVEFHKFIVKLRKKFSRIFLQALKIQVVSKNILRYEEWKEIERKIKVIYSGDNEFTELKLQEILSNRMNNVQSFDGVVGKYVSKRWVWKKLLRLSEDEIGEMEKEIEKERKAGVYNDPNAPQEGEGGAPEGAPPEGQEQPPEEGEEEQEEQPKAPAKKSGKKAGGDEDDGYEDDDQYVKDS